MAAGTPRFGSTGLSKQRGQTFPKNCEGCKYVVLLWTCRSPSTGGCRWHAAVNVLLAVRRFVVQGGSTALEQLTKKPGFFC